MVDRPLDAILLLLAIFVTWKSFPALGDMGLCAGLIGCFPDILASKSNKVLKPSIATHLVVKIYAILCSPSPSIYTRLFFFLCYILFGYSPAQAMRISSTLPPWCMVSTQV